MFTVQIEEFRNGTLRNAETADGIPAPKHFDFHVVSKLILIFERFTSLVFTPDISEVLAGFFLLQNAKVADQASETATGEAATGEAKEE